MFLSKENKQRVKKLLEKVFNKNDSTVFHFIKMSKKESDHQYQIVFKTRKKITSEKIKTAEKLLKSEFDGENWELHRWNEILKPEIPLHPNYVKALKATESSFNENPPSPTKDHKAIGLMQIMPETVGYLGPRSKDIKDHFIEISLEDARDPSVAIAAATRWLFRKHRLVIGKKKGATWMDALEEYKGITNQKGAKPAEIRLKLNQFYKKLQERL